METKSDRLDGINSPQEAADTVSGHMRQAQQELDKMQGSYSHSRVDGLRRAAKHLQDAADIQEAANQEFGTPE